ncbi:MAG: cysteine desulfurase [Candidatus Aenigmarchaeota archaeon]|nr:cysteine desulfurase [Candidatus Aenigmarchaeota archaeon]
MNAMKIREDFPILRRKVNKRQLAYLDNAATTQKPKQVIDKITDYYMNYNANIHRGIHKLSEEATEAYEGSRGKTAKFVNAQSREIVFTKNTTESLNILAYWAFRTLKKGDEVVVSIMEHHSNIVPWQMLIEKGVKLNIAGIRKDGSLDIKNLQSLVTKKTKIVSIAHSSNVLGTINPVKEIGRIAHDAGAICVIDGAQSVPHMPVDMKTLDCDFLAFSSHKMLGPTGIGVLYGKEDMLKSVTPFLRGGDMIKEVFQQTASWNDIPWKFEAGTPNIADVIGFGAAVDYLNKIGMKEVRKHEEELTKYAIKKMSPISGVTIHGLAAERGGAVSFSIDGVHPHDIATILDGEGIAIRSGHMCAQPLMAHLNVPALARASFYVYNMKEEIDRLIVGIEKVKKIFKTGR